MEHKVPKETTRLLYNKLPKVFTRGVSLFLYLFCVLFMRKLMMQMSSPIRCVIWLVRFYLRTKSSPRINVQFEIS